MTFRLEICVDTVESAVTARDACADRIELCGSLPEGGTTPGYGTIMSARSNLDIGIHVMIRPRGGDFLYSDLEFDIMRRDIEICGECGIDGVVFGILQAGGTIDVERTGKLVEFAHPMSVTFHRAFDMCNDPSGGLEDIIATGADRVLSSGQKNIAEDGIELLREMVIQAGDRITVMAGGGIDESNVALIVTSTKVKEIHMTGRKIADSEMVFRRSGINLGSIPGIPEFSRRVANPERIANVISILKSL
jgi:copper homeostasis protein